MIKERVPGEVEPTEGQKKAGNYFKGHKNLHGMRISLENAAGTKRRGVGRDGKPWESEMAHDYGYIRGTTGKDKDHLDVFLGPEADNPDHKVYIIDQDDDKGGFDEHKIMMGFPSVSEAYAAYHANYPAGHSGFNDITESDLATFKKWAFAGKGAKRTRASEMKYFGGGLVEAQPDVSMEDVQNFAKGGTVTGQETVGLGTFGGSDQQNSVVQAQPMPINSGVGAGNAPATSTAPGLPQPGPQFTDQVYDAENDPLLRAQLQMGGRGGYISGAGAFLGGAYNPFGFEVGPTEGEIRMNYERPEHSLDQLRATAGALGLDPSSYAETYSPGRFGFLNNPQLQEQLDPGRASAGSPRDMQTLYSDLNDYTKDYVAIDHMTPNGRNMERTLYVKRDGKLLPVSNPQRRSSRQDNTFFGDEFKEALMTIGPAVLGGFGGWAGLMGQAGTTAAPYINAAGNAVVGGLSGGTEGAARSLVGSAGGAAGGAAFSGALGQAYDNIGRQIGSRLASAVYSNNRRD